MTTLAVIGASGQVGRAVVDTLTDRDVEVVRISRSGQGPGHRTVSDYEAPELARALAGCDVAVATLGLPYRSSVWADGWPMLAASVGQACADAGVPLTFLDNLYPVGAPSGPITESSPLEPCSTKGLARLAGVKELERLRAEGLDVVLARAADFVGPGVEVTALPWRGLTTAVTGRRGSLTWYGRGDVQHSFAWVPQIAACLVQIALDRELRRDETVNLPVLAPVTGDAVAAILSDLRGSPVRLRTMGERAMRAASLVSSAAKEQREMMYAVERDFIVSDCRIRSRGWAGETLTLTDCLAKTLGRR
ncbi:MAG: NAD-dependent epimerase/dehydratase family protein [Micrococcales bacterium]|nr:NAD-dependent epimerase/dehydratase family protein [Micrococcales bacterium]